MTTSESNKHISAPVAGEIDVAVNTLRPNALRFPTILVLCIAAIAPAASMLFNVPVMTSQAGASVALVFVLASIGILLLGVSVVYFARRLSSAAGFSTWVCHGLGRGAAFQAGWLLLGGYSLFEAALQSTVGGSLDPLLAGMGFHLPGGWMTYALLLTLIVGILSYFSITTSIWIMAPFAVLEVLALVILNVAITLRGGVSGHDLVHTFTPAGALVKGVAPGGALGIGIAMALGILAFVGFETAAVYGEEAKSPTRTIPRAVIALIIGLAILYTWTAYSATIGVGWQHAGTVLGNVANAPQQYLTLATTFVGSWLGIALVIFVITSNFASAFAMHQAMVRYFYDMARAGLFPPIFGRTHPRWKSPFVASIAQSLFSLILIGFLGLIIQHINPDGSSSYALGFADGRYWQQTNGTVSFGWLASIVTMCILVVYVLTNVAAPFFARRRNELRLLPHVLAPGGSTVLLLLPLASYVGPALPGSIGAFFTTLGFAPTPFPSNMICQQCGYERATTQPSCPICGTTQLSLPFQANPMVMPSGPGATWIPSMSTRATTLSPTQTSRTALREASARVPGRTLQGQLYHLLVQQEQRQWSPGISETWWLAKDVERGNAVTICEIVLPLSGSDLLTFFRVATKAVMLRSTHPQMSALLTVFLEQGHGFFVFAHPTGESLQARIGRRDLVQEAEARDGYRQLADALWFFSQQYPPLVHGSIQSEHLMQVGSRWVLTHASPLVAGGVTQCVPALKTTRQAAESTPAADLFMLSTTIYYSVIGCVPPAEVAEQQAQVMRAGLPPTFATLLLKGVHPRPQERYQSPYELLEALGQRPTRSDEGARRQRRRSTLGQVAPQLTPAQAQNQRAPVFPTPPPVELPRPAHYAPGKDPRVSSENLASVAAGRDRLTALGWISGVLLVGLIILLMAR